MAKTKFRPLHDRVVVKRLDAAWAVGTNQGGLDTGAEGVSTWYHLWLIKRTDWSAVGEAAAPEIDDAEYADLDAIIAALPPEEDELVTTS